MENGESEEQLNAADCETCTDSLQIPAPQNHT